MGIEKYTIGEYCTAFGARSLVGRAVQSKEFGLYEVDSVEPNRNKPSDPRVNVFGYCKSGKWVRFGTLGTIELISDSRLVSPRNLASAMKEVESGKLVSKWEE